MLPFSPLGLLALSWLTTTASAVGLSTCQFSLKGFHFDLCPVLRPDSDGVANVRTVVVEKSTPPTVKKSTYRISFNGPLKRNDKLSADKQCPEGTWICMTERRTYPNRTKDATWITQVVPVAGNPPLEANHTRSHHPGLNATAQFSKKSKGLEHAPLDVSLHGGLYVDVAQTASFRFMCNHTAEEPTHPRFLMQWGGYHVFRWDTRHACAKSAANRPDPTPEAPAESTPDPDPAQPPSPSDEIPDENAPDEDKEKLLLPGSPIDSPSRRLSATTVLISSFVLLTLAYLIYNNMPRIRGFVYRRRKGGRFRVGEQRLLRWVQEDLGLDEDDVMVNSAEANQANTEDMPLAPSPRKPAFNRAYGTAG